MTGLIVLILRVLLALALYAFLALALWMLWQDIQRTGVRVAGRTIPSLRLEIRARNKPAVYQNLHQPEATLGRDPGCDVPIADASVAPRHAIIRFDHGHWWLENLTSTNRTQLNHEKLSRATALTVGDEIAVGQARVLVSSARRTAATGKSGYQRKNG